MACMISPRELVLSRKPATPARSASWKVQSSSNEVSAMTRARSPRSTICRVAWIPSSTGMLMSIRITSGSRRLAVETAVSPFEAAPTTTIPGMASTMRWMRARTWSWSSAIRTRISASFMSLNLVV